MDKSYKNLKISPKLHKELKIFCVTKGIKLNEWVENQLQKKINEIKNENKME